MPELTLTGIVLELERKATNAHKAAHSYGDTEPGSPKGSAQFAWERVLETWEEARDLVCDLLSQELAKPDELQALREAARRAEDRMQTQLDIALQRADEDPGEANYAGAMSTAITFLREEAENLMGEGES